MVKLPEGYTFSAQPDDDTEEKEQPAVEQTQQSILPEGYSFSAKPGEPIRSSLDKPVVEEKPDPFAETEDKPDEEKKEQDKPAEEDKEQKLKELEEELKTKLGDNYKWYMEKLMASTNK